jgi:adenylate cyclase
MPAIRENSRMDFKVQILDSNEESGLIRFALRPDPRRYEWIEHDGSRALLDRFDNTVIPEHVLAEAARNVAGVPITFAPPLIEDAQRYIQSRRVAIEDALAGADRSSDLADPAGELLADLAGYKLDFAIISVDLVGSTKLAASIPADDYTRLMSTFVWELSRIAPLFRGHVLKYTGDGLIVFIPGPSRNQQNDLVIDCALTMRGLVYEALNPALQNANLPRIDVRLGIDSGEASVLVLGNPETKRHADIIGDVVSLACKVEGSGEPGEIRVGGVATRAMHTHWRELLEAVELSDDWPYVDETGAPYEVYRVVETV